MLQLEKINLPPPSPLPRSQSRLKQNISKWPPRWRTLWHIDVSETLSLSCILRLVCVRSLEIAWEAKNMEVRNCFITASSLTFLKSVDCSCWASFDWVQCEFWPDHFSLYRFVDRQESYALLSFAFLIQSISGEACEIEIILKNIKFSFKDLTVLLVRESFFWSA